MPANQRDRLIQEAAIVAALARARTQLRLAEFECDLVVASGSMLGGDCAPLTAAACLLNGLLPVRFCQLAQDQASSLPMLGCLDLLGESVDPSDALVPLATSVAATGSARVNEPALHVAAQRDDGSGVEEVVPFGATLRVAALAGQTVRIGATPAGGLDVGGGPGRAVGLSPFVASGVGGLLVDARGRPPAEGADADERAELVLAWMQGLAAYGAESTVVFEAPDVKTAALLGTISVGHRLPPGGRMLCSPGQEVIPGRPIAEVHAPRKVLAVALKHLDGAAVGDSIPAGTIVGGEGGWRRRRQQLDWDARVVALNPAGGFAFLSGPEFRPGNKGADRRRGRAG